MQNTRLTPWICMRIIIWYFCFASMDLHAFSPVGVIESIVIQLFFLVCSNTLVILIYIHPVLNRSMNWISAHRPLFVRFLKSKPHEALQSLAVTACGRPCVGFAACTPRVITDLSHTVLATRLALNIFMHRCTAGSKLRFARNVLTAEISEDMSQARI